MQSRMTNLIRDARVLLKRRDIVIATVILAGGIAVRLPFVLVPPSPNGLNNVDELALALSVVDRWLGLPPINLCGPGLPLQFFTFVAFAPEFLWSIATDPSLVRLSDTIARHYDDPSSLILTMRLISSIGGAVAALFAYLIVRKLAKDTFAALAVAIIVTFLPISMQQSLVGTNDMIALMFAMAAAYGLVSTPAKPILVGLASAAVVATKVPLAVWLVPVFVGGAIFVYEQQGGRALLSAIARCVGAGAIGLVLFDPYLWLEPVRSIKAVVGNVLAHTNSSVPDFAIFSAVVPGKAVLIGLIAATLVATLMAWKDRRRLALIALGLIVAALFAFFWRSGFDYWRYMLGALVPGIVLFAAICARGRGILFASSLALFVLGLGAIELFDQVQIRKTTAPSLSAMVEDMCRRGDTIWM
jgi:Dolichyl-phosphate-mannose-protein mannosyltransferase